MEKHVIRDYFKKLNIFNISDSNRYVLSENESPLSSPSAAGNLFASSFVQQDPMPAAEVPSEPKKSILSSFGGKHEHRDSTFCAPAAGSSLLAADLVIDGSVSSQSDLVIEGTVNGDVVCSMNVEITGTVKGNISGKNIRCIQAQITGDIKAEESFVAQGSTVTGNVVAASADIDSPVTGDISAERMLYIRKSAVITGDITAAAITVEEHAVLDGKFSIRPQ